MEMRHRILEFSGKNNPRYDILRAELDAIGATYEITSFGLLGGVERTTIEFIIAEHSPLYPRVAELIRIHGFHVQAALHFSDDDINNAEWCYALSSESQYPQPKRTYLDATYDISEHCQFCGMGGEQNNPFRLKSDFKSNRRHFFGLHWVFDEVFVRPVVREIFENAGIREVGYLHPVLDRNGQPIETVYQVLVKNVANPGLVTKDLQRVTCKEVNEEYKRRPDGFGEFGTARDPSTQSYCGRVKYHYPLKTMMTFKKEALTGQPDIVKSYEWFGSGGSADRPILVSNRLIKLVKDRGLRGWRFTPVQLV